MYHIPLDVQFTRIYRCSEEGSEDGDEKEGSELPGDGRKWRLPGLLYAHDLVIWGDSEVELRAMVGRFTEVCMKRGLKVNADKSKVMVLNGAYGLECEVHTHMMIHLEHVSEFKYLGCVLNESDTDGA